MTEQEYIDATNLWKTRMAIHAIGETTTANDDERDLRDEAIEALYKWSDLLEKKVKIKG